MCGLVGVLGEINATQKKIFKQLLLADTVRGYHSTGVIKNTRTATEWRKKGVSGYDFCVLNDAWINDTATIGLIGHNRQATKGAINDKNSHPFEHGKIVGVHNGTLRRQSLLDNWNEHEVDSDNVFSHLNKNGINDTVSKLDGAFAIVYQDTETGLTHIFRNNERPLFGAIHNKTIYYASEKNMLYWILHRNNVKVRHEDITEFETETLYSIDSIGLLSGSKTFITKTPLEYYVPPKTKAYIPTKGVVTHGSVSYLTEKVEWAKKHQISYDKDYAFVVDELKRVGRDDVAVFQLVCEPYISITGICYSPQTLNEAKDALTDDTILKGKISFNAITGQGTIYIRTTEKADDEFMDEIFNRDDNELCEEGECGKDSRDNPLSKKEWNKKKIAKSGCIDCGDDIVPWRGEKVYWLDDETGMCECCAEAIYTKDALHAMNCPD